MGCGQGLAEPLSSPALPNELPAACHLAPLSSSSKGGIWNRSLGPDCWRLMC